MRTRSGSGRKPSLSPYSIKKLGEENQLPFASGGCAVLKLGVVPAARSIDRPGWSARSGWEIGLTHWVSLKRGIFNLHLSF